MRKISVIFPFEFEPVVQEMSFKEFSILALTIILFIGAKSLLIRAILVKGIMGNIPVLILILFSTSTQQSFSYAGRVFLG